MCIVKSLSNFKIQTVSIGLLACLLSFNSCSDSSDNSMGEIVPTVPAQGQALSPTQQKEKLEEIAIDLMNQVPSSDFQVINDEIADVELGYYLNDYDWGYVEDWADNCMNDCCEALGTTTEVNDNGYSKYNSFYDNYKAILLASNFNGRFTAKNGKWTRSEANGVQFVIPEKNCVLSLTTSGNVKKVYAFNLENWKDYDLSYEGGQYVWNDYYDRVQCTIGVPENIVVTLEVNNNVLVKTTVAINLSDITNEKFDIAKNSISAVVSTELSNGYKFQISECSYRANNSISLVESVSKNGAILLTSALASTIENIPSYNLDAFTTGADVDSDDFEDANALNAFVKFDVLGKLQIQGKISDIRRFADYISSANEEDDNEKNFKSYINQANSLMDVNLFYNGSAVKQASVKLEAFSDEDWWGDRYWESEPVMCFYDGSSYSTFEAFFNDSEFKTVMEKFEKLISKYEKMLES